MSFQVIQVQSFDQPLVVGSRFARHLARRRADATGLEDGTMIRKCLAAWLSSMFLLTACARAADGRAWRGD